MNVLDVYVTRLNQVSFDDVMSVLESIVFVLRESSSEDLIHAINALHHARAEQTEATKTKNDMKL